MRPCFGSNVLFARKTCQFFSVDQNDALQTLCSEIPKAFREHGGGGEYPFEIPATAITPLKLRRALASIERSSTNFIDPYADFIEPETPSLMIPPHRHRISDHEASDDITAATHEK